MNKVKLGIIGLGQRGFGLANTILACKNAQIVAICDLYQDNIEKTQKAIFEKENRNAVVYKDYKELLNANDVDAVIVASSWDEHIRMAIESMKAGKITAMEVGGAYDVEECWELVRAYEETKTPFVILENCCFNSFELLVTALHRAGKLGEIVHCHGAYRHDLRDEILGGNVNHHYRLENYKKRNCENYPTHELGPIAKLLDINRGNKFLTVSSFATKAVGLEEFSHTDKNPDKSLIGQKFSQGDIVTTTITCANGQTITLTLNTTLPSYYSRELEVHSTKGICKQEENMIMLEGEVDLHEFWDTNKIVEKHLNNADNYKSFLPEYWQNITEEDRKSGHGGMDYFQLTSIFDNILNNEELPIDVYDAASWMCITALSEASIACGGMPQPVPDFTRGKWVTRKRKDVIKF